MMLDRETVLEYLQRAQLLYKKLRNGPALFQLTEAKAVSRAVFNLPRRFENAKMELLKNGDSLNFMKAMTEL
eukprot:2603-Chlamydomonas_euryale.AAC.1